MELPKDPDGAQRVPLGLDIDGNPEKRARPETGVICFERNDQPDGKPYSDWNGYFIRGDAIAMGFGFYLDDFAAKLEEQFPLHAPADPDAPEDAPRKLSADPNAGIAARSLASLLRDMKKAIQ